MGKILVNENRDKAEKLIDSLENEYIPIIRSIAIDIAELTDEPITKELIIASIKDGCEKIGNLYIKKGEAEFANIESETIRTTLMNQWEGPKKIDKIQSYIASRLVYSSTLIGNIPISDTKFYSYFEVDEQGHVYISDEIKESIYESSKKYIETKEGERIYKLHKETAEALQKFSDALFDAGFQINSMYTNLIFAPFFKIDNSKERIRISPKDLRYDEIE